MCIGSKSKVSGTDEKTSNEKNVAEFEEWGRKGIQIRVIVLVQEANGIATELEINTEIKEGMTKKIMKNKGIVSRRITDWVTKKSSEKRFSASEAGQEFALLIGQMVEGK